MLNGMKKNLGLALGALLLFIGSMSGGAVVTWLQKPAHADQSERIVPTAGVYTGPQYAQLIGDMARSVSTANKGSTAPANVSGSAVDGLEWLDDSTTPWVKKRYINGGWVTEGAYDTTTPSFIGLLGGGGLGTVASASVTDLNSVYQSNVSITGTTTITSFGSAAPTGTIKFIRFAAALTLTYSSALPVPTGGYDLVTAANDRAIVTHLGSGNWEFTQYTRANGIPIDASAVGEIKMGMWTTVPANHVAAYGQALTRTSYPAYVAKVTRAQNGTRTASNATITSVADTTGFGAGMPVEGTGLTGCTIASVTSSTIVLASGACVGSSGTSTVTVFVTGYGTSGTTSTVGAPPCRGKAIAGRDHTLPGAAADLLTSTYFGADSKIFNVSGGSESVTMAAANIYSHYHDVFLNDPGHTHGMNGTVDSQTNAGGLWIGVNRALGGQTATVSNTTGMSVRSASGGGGTADRTATTGSASPTPMRTTQPTLVAECIIRVTP